MNKFILLSTGILITIILILFPTNILELLYYDNEFSNEMYNNKMYFNIVLIISITAWAIAAIYYYVVNSVYFSRWYHWIISLIISSFITSLLCNIYITNLFDSLDLDFTGRIFDFSVRLFFLESILYIIVSFSIRWWSSNCRHTPIPE